MGEHKHNPTTIAAKNGELPPKKPKLSKHQRDALLVARIEQMTGAAHLKGILNQYK